MVGARWSGWVLLRPWPTLGYGLSAVAVGACLARRPWAPHAWAALGLAAAGVGVVQGVLAHAWNDRQDRASGADARAASDWDRWVAPAVVLYAALGAAGVLLRGPWAGVLAALGIWSAWAYSVPAWRLAYRPFWGEWGAIFPGVAAAVVAGSLAAGGLTGSVGWAAGLEGGLTVAAVLHHHLRDVETDWSARPQKRTTPAWWRHRRGGDPRLPAGVAAALVTVGGVVAAAFWTPFLGTAVAGLLAAWLAFRPDLRPWAVSRRDRWFKGLVAAHALWLVAAGLGR
ncbi:MAG: prenyltransferase [Firmicutes bacterium]|nr:prenyltransferase [Alicyclobacillaceae bacterium]MCL6496282.1 prenyltransferase [Bacillota bacterium]